MSNLNYAVLGTVYKLQPTTIQSIEVAVYDMLYHKSSVIHDVETSMIALGFAWNNFAQASL